MKKLSAVLLLAAFAAAGLSAPAVKAQEKKEKAAAQKEFRWHGSVVRINKDDSTLDVRKGHITRTVHYNSDTKWTKKTPEGQVASADLSEIKEGDSVICLGNYNEKKEFWATRIDLRLPKKTL